MDESKKKTGWQKHSNQGREFEARIDAQHALYQAQGLAVMIRQNVPIRWSGGRPAVRGRAIVDYLGSTRFGAVAIEAKNPSSGFLDLCNADVIEPHQVEFMRLWRPVGLGFYLFCFGRGAIADAVLVPAQIVVDLTTPSWPPKHVRWREADAIAAGGVKVQGVDWIPTVTEEMRKADQAGRMWG
jgi:hypothetical protein